MPIFINLSLIMTAFKISSLLVSAAMGWNMNDNAAKRTRGKPFTGALTLLCHAMNVLTDNSEHRAKWTIPLCVQINLARFLTQLHPGQHLFLHHIISVIIYHSRVICSQPSLCRAICMIYWMPRLLISLHFTARLD